MYSDGSSSPNASKLQDATDSFLTSLPSFLMHYGCSVLRVRKFSADTFYLNGRTIRLNSALAVDCRTAKAAPPPNVYAERLRSTVVGYDSNAVKRAVANCLRLKSVALADWFSARDSIQRLLAGMKPLGSRNRTALLPLIVYAAGQSDVASVIITDAVPSPPQPIPTLAVGTSVIMIVTPAADAWGGAAESARRAQVWAAKVKGLIVIPFTELEEGGEDYWISTLRLHRDSARTTP